MSKKEIGTYVKLVHRLDQLDELDVTEVEEVDHKHCGVTMVEIELSVETHCLKKQNMNKNTVASVEIVDGVGEIQERDAAEVLNIVHI